MGTIAIAILSYYLETVAEQQRSISDNQSKVITKQLEVMKNQLDQMKIQSDLTKTQLKANIKFSNVAMNPVISGQILSGWNVNPVWQNSGQTDAKDFAAWWQIHVRDASDIGGDYCNPFPNPLVPSNKTILSAGNSDMFLSKFLDRSDAEKVISGKSLIFIAAHLEYKDIFSDSSPHTIDWCVRAEPNDIEKNIFSFLTLKMESI